MERYLKSRYKIGDQISENPFSATYQGSFMSSNKPVIIKIYKRGTLNSSLIKRMKQKVRDLSLLNHHGIVKLIDGDYGWQGFYYVREYVEGKSLKELLAAGTGVGPEKGGAIIAEVCAALEMAHQKGIIHGAIKPGNIFIDQQGLVRLADFVIEGEIMEAMPQKPLMIMENGRYTSPEELTGVPATVLSDIYSLGLVLAETAGLNVGSVVRSGLAGGLAKIRESARFERETFAALPKYLQDVISQATKTDPLLRFRSAADLGVSLKNRSLIRPVEEQSEYLKIFENTAEEQSGGGRELAPEVLEDLGRVRLRWNLERHRNWLLAVVLAAAVASGIIYSFLFGR